MLTILVASSEELSLRGPLNLANYNESTLLSDLTYSAVEVADKSSESGFAVDGQSSMVGVLYIKNENTSTGLSAPNVIQNSASGDGTRVEAALYAPSIGTSPVRVDAANAWINVSTGIPYEFPCIENSQLSPAQFSKDVVYNNNISSKGQFLGRTAVRRGATVTLKPLSFIATVDRMNEVLELFEKLETRACYVHYKVADKDFVHYGWTESEPKYRYTADEEYVQVSFTLRCPA